MATVILARHGRTEANTKGVLAGRSAAVHLDEVGERQAEAAGHRTADLALAVIVSSPLERCRETAQAIKRAQPNSVRVRTDKELTEVDYGSWTGQPLKALAKQPLWKSVQAHPAGVVFPDGESMAAMSARVVAAVRRWNAAVEAEHGPYGVLLVSCHGDPIKAVLADALGMHLDAFQRIVVDPGSLSVVRYTPLRPFVLSLNSKEGDLSHLRPPPRKSRTRRSASDASVGGGAGPNA